MKECKCCGNLTLSVYSNYDICDVCGWIDDPCQNENPTQEDGANDFSLEEYRQNCITNGVDMD